VILVTGGAGFIGSNVVAALCDRGDAVAVCDRFGRDDKWNNLRKHAVFDFVAPRDCIDWLQRHHRDVTAVVHMGAITATTEPNVDRLVVNNIRCSIDLWEYCTHAGVPFLYASSAATYGDGSQGFDDDWSETALSRLRPLNAYAWSKHLFDRRVSRIVEHGGPTPPQWAGLKFFNVYGPNEYHKGDMRSVVARNYPRAAEGRVIRLFKSHRDGIADGDQRRDFVYVRDCVNVVLWLLGEPSVSGIFNVGSGQARSFLDLVTALYTAVGREPAVKFVDMPLELRDKYQYHTVAKLDRLRKAGYAADSTPLEDGVVDYVQRFLAQADRYR